MYGSLGGGDEMTFQCVPSQNGLFVDVPHRQRAIVSRQDRVFAPVVTDATDLTASVSPWLQADHDNLTGTVLRLPDRVDIDTPVQEQLIVEFYSK